MTNYPFLCYDYVVGSFPNLIIACVANMEPLLAISISFPTNGTLEVSLFHSGFLSQLSTFMFQEKKKKL
ncbi:hypothetical protein HanIR_Chr05g0231931 [Helianthus annuus]|nr:hypothetical protein HanIR_Chr05g0231931 [Helianthus annuus]